MLCTYETLSPYAAKRGWDRGAGEGWGRQPREAGGLGSLPGADMNISRLQIRVSPVGDLALPPPALAQPPRTGSQRARQ